jgi:cytidine deaminase
VRDFTSEEKELIAHAEKAVVKYNKLRKAKGGIDTLYAFVMSNSGEIYDGACLETTISDGNLCGERHAIANMVLGESYNARIKHVVVADPVPKIQKNSTTPCGTCRHVIWELGTPDTTVICIQYIQQKDGWIFPKMEKHTIKELYPHPYTPIKWGR